MKKFFSIVLTIIMGIVNGTSYQPSPEKQYTAEVYRIDESEAELPDYRSQFSGGNGTEPTLYNCRTTNYYPGKSSYLVSGSRGGSGYWLVDGQSAKIKKVKNPGKYEDKYKLKIKKMDLPAYNFLTLDEKSKEEFEILDKLANGADLGKKKEKKKALKKVKGVFCKIPKGTWLNKLKDGTVVAGSSVKIICPFNAILTSSSKTVGTKRMVLHCENGGTSYEITFNNMVKWYCDIDRPDNSTTHTSAEQQGKSFKAGQVLGFGNSETTATIKVMKDDDILAVAPDGGYCTIEDFYRGEYHKFKKTVKPKKKKKKKNGNQGQETTETAGT